MNRYTHELICRFLPLLAISSGLSWAVGGWPCLLLQFPIFLITYWVLYRLLPVPDDEDD